MNYLKNYNIEVVSRNTSILFIKYHKYFCNKQVIIHYINLLNISKYTLDFIAFLIVKSLTKKCTKNLIFLYTKIKTV